MLTCYPFQLGEGVLEESLLRLGHPPKGGLQHQGIGCMLPFLAY